MTTARDPLALWRKLLDTGQLPRWLEDFALEPDPVIAQILSGDRVVQGRSPEESVDNLVEWISVLGTTGQFLDLIDQGVARFIALNWDDLDDNRSARAVAAAFELLAEVKSLVGAGALLREAVAGRNRLESAPKEVDLPGAYLNALATHQVDRTLVPLWRETGSLPPDASSFAGRYAIRGMEFAPALKIERGGFRREVAQTVVDVVEALTRRVLESNELEASAARDEQRALARMSYSAYPDEHAWRQVIEDRLLDDQMYEPTLRDIFGFLDLASLPQLRSTSDLPDPRGWSKRAQSVAAGLRANEPASRAKAEELLALQREYAIRTANASYVVFSLAHFSGALRIHDQAQAERWAREAIWWQPSEASGWTALVIAITPEAPVRGVELAWRTAARFPENRNSWRVLERALEIAQLFDTSSLVGHYMARRFGDGSSASAGAGDDLEVRAQLLERGPESLVGEARVRRREITAGDCPDAAGALDEVRALLAEVRALWPGHVAVEREEALAGIEDSPPVLVATFLEARRVREDARGRQLNHDTEIDALTAPWRRMRELDSAVLPASLLGQVRACVAAVDGEGLAAEVRYAFSRLADWGWGHRRSYPTNTFESDWLERVDSVFDIAAGSTVTPSGIDLLRAGEAFQRVTLDELEEDVAVPLERLSDFDPGFAVAPE